MHKITYIYSALMMASGLIFSSWAYLLDIGRSSIIYWGVLPGLPFILLSVLAVVFKKRFLLAPFLGAALASLLAIVLPYGSLWYASVTYSGGGANIGLGLLLIALPIYLPVFMIIGWFIGKANAKG